MKYSYDSYVIILSGYFIMSGTFILSRNLFDNNMKRLINLAHNQSKLPFFVKLAVFCFGYRKKLTDIEFFDVEHYPTSNNFSYKQILKIIEPFIGFIFILIGTVLSLLI